MTAHEVPAGSTASPDESYAVVVPCRNAQAWIGACVASCLRQHPLPSQIIVVDDGSTDASVEIAATVSLPPGVTLLVHREEGIGAARAREAGVHLARAQWLLFLDADDELEPDSVGRLLARRDGSDVVHGDALATDEAGAPLTALSLAPATEHPMAAVFFKAPLCGTALVRRSSHMPWSATHEQVDEFFYFANLAVHGRRFTHVPVSVLRYRQHASADRKSNRGFDYGTALARAFVELWETARETGDEEDLGGFVAWIMADLSLRTRMPDASTAVSRYAVSLRRQRLRRLGFALRHYGPRRVLRLLVSWPR